MDSNNCKGCIHYRPLASGKKDWMCCNYIFDEGTRRPCPPGEACTVKQIGDNKMASAKWDTALGEKMYRECASSRKIAEAVGISKGSIDFYAKNHGWQRDESVQTEKRAKAPKKEKPEAESAPMVREAEETAEAFLNKELVKDKEGKPDLFHLPVTGMYAMAEIMEYGAKKYAPGSWKQVPATDYLEAIARHLYRIAAGELKDQESGKSHIKHLLCDAWYACALMEEEQNDK